MEDRRGIVREDVLHLTYTAHDMAPFASDQGYDGPPFRWTKRTGCGAAPGSTRCSFIFTGSTATPPIRHRRLPDREARGRGALGPLRSRDMIQGYMAALAAGAPDADVAG